MDIQSAEQSFQDVTYGNETFDQLLKHIEQKLPEGSHHLSLFIGMRDKPKQKALKQMAEKSGLTIQKADANELISKIESETYKNLDHLFAEFTPKDSLLYLENGSRLCGVYTGYTHSKVKYATPQERYFLKKIQETGGFFVIDISDATDADATIRRAAQSIVNFPLPKSVIKRFIWKLKHFSFHGYQLKTKRPEHYRNQAGNF